MANSDSEKTSALYVNFETAPTLTKGHLRVAYIFPAAHAFLVLATWASSSLLNRGVAEGLTGPLISILSTLLFVVDLPFSIVAFGVMFGGGKAEIVAAVASGVGCTLWWYLLGRALDALIRRKSHR